MARVIVLCNQKGGVGKTTVTGGLAAVTAAQFPPVPPASGTTRDEFQPQVLAVSTDPQGSLTSWMDAVDARLEGLDLPMPLDYAQKHNEPEVLEDLRHADDYVRVYVDCPGWLEDVDDDGNPLPPNEQDDDRRAIMDATLASADQVVVPVPPEEMAFEPTERTIEHVLKPRGLDFIVVVNAWDPRDGDGDLTDTQKWIKGHGWPMATTVVRRYKLHTSAKAAGRLCTHYPKNRSATEARNDFLSLAGELAIMGSR